MRKYLQLFKKIDNLLQNGPVIFAIDGGSASGKTTLAKMLSEIYDANVFHIDDFFLRPEQRTQERLSEVGGNFDRERFLSEVLIPLKEGREVRYSRFDCSTQSLLPPTKVLPKPLTIIEGVYSLHPELLPFYNSSLFLHIPPELQRERILKRNTPALAKRFFEEWIPMENAYFDATDLLGRADLCLGAREDF